MELANVYGHASVVGRGKDEDGRGFQSKTKVEGDCKGASL